MHKRNVKRNMIALAYHFLVFLVEDVDRTIIAAEHERRPSVEFEPSRADYRTKKNWANHLQFLSIA